MALTQDAVDINLTPQELQVLSELDRYRASDYSAPFQLPLQLIHSDRLILLSLQSPVWLPQTAQSGKCEEESASHSGKRTFHQSVRNLLLLRLESIYYNQAIQYLERMLIQAHQQLKNEPESHDKGIDIDPKTYCKLGHFHLLLEDYPKGVAHRACTQIMSNSRKHNAYR